MDVVGKSDGIDESLYSRQLYVMGHEAQARMARADVLLIGANGMGVEAAKDTILAGIKSMTIFDNTPTTYGDLASNFYLSESDIGTPRARACVAKLKELNPYVSVSVFDGPELTFDVVTQFSVVVMIDCDLDWQKAMNDFCHSRNICFIAGESRGVLGSVFCDFGKGFVVYDKDGEEPASSLIAGIALQTSEKGEGETKEGDDTRIVVTTLEETRHRLESGDVVRIADAEGFTCLNDKEFSVSVIDTYSFALRTDSPAVQELLNTQACPLQNQQYVRGGYVVQVKQQQSIDFVAMSQALEAPQALFVGDIMKAHKIPAQHLALQAIHAFRKERAGAADFDNASTGTGRGRLPVPGRESDAARVVALAGEANSSLSPDAQLDAAALKEAETMIKRIALSAAGLVGPVCAVLGGVMAQEILKACTGKFMPTRQWFYYDALEALPDDILPEAEVAPRGCRYDGQIAVFGASLQEKILGLKTFLVGAGAIGCEVLKNWACMGVACGTSGRVMVTDMDTIEKSNLSRQFLFRSTDINQLKSATAARAAKQMNTELQITALDEKVAPDTEKTFNDNFWETLDVCCTALDNVEARLYVDQRCLFYHVPMLESGTLGTKGNTQVVVPGKTEHYGASRDPPEKSVPVCTLKNFPNQIDHTIQWAMDWFEGIYKQVPGDCNQFLNSTDFSAELADQQDMRLEKLERIREAMLDGRPQSVADCLRWARLVFEDVFSNKIKQLMHSFPLDRLTAQGVPFWSGSKKPPHALDFDANDALHMEFVLTAANLKARCYGIEMDWDTKRGQAVLASMTIEPFVPSDGVKIAVTEEEAKQEAKSAGGGATSSGAFRSAAEVDSRCDEILASLPSKQQTAALVEIDFDKDLDEEMRVVNAVSNLRARNYKIPEVNLHDGRKIAGKIIPAISTTTALVSGAICMELFKVLQNKPLDQYLVSFMNLALPFFTSMEPMPPTTTTCIVKGSEWKWTQWDRIDIDCAREQVTVDGLITRLEERYGVVLQMLSSGVSILYSDFMDKKKRTARLAMGIRELVENVTKKSLPIDQKYLILEVIVADVDTDEEVEIPYVRFCLL